MSGADNDSEPSVGRIEAFSDGVIAIIITIMVLELKAPEEPGLAHLWRLWPTLLAYALSFAYVGVYWANHHRLFSHARRVTNGLVWCNLGLLFTLSLVPVSTAYLGGQHFSRDATLVYLVSMLLPAIFYLPLEGLIRRTGSHSEASERYHRRMMRKGMLATALYVAGFPLAFVSPWLGVACAALVALLWCLPHSAIDQWFGD